MDFRRLKLISWSAGFGLRDFWWGKHGRACRDARKVYARRARKRDKRAVAGEIDRQVREMEEDARP